MPTQLRSKSDKRMLEECDHTETVQQYQLVISSTPSFLFSEYLPFRPLPVLFATISVTVLPSIRASHRNFQ